MLRIEMELVIAEQLLQRSVLGVIVSEDVDPFAVRAGNLQLKGLSRQKDDTGRPNLYVDRVHLSNDHFLDVGGAIGSFRHDLAKRAWVVDGFP